MAVDLPTCAGALARLREFPTLGHLLQWRAAHQPKATAFVFLADGEDDEQCLTYAELDRQARAIAVELRRRGAQGERALLVYDAGLEYIAALYGCLYAGVVAVPVYPPDPYRVDRTLPRLQAIVADAGAAWVLSTDAMLTWSAALFAELPGLKAIVATDRVAAQQEPDDIALATGPDSTALLQYTSGSTGNPRGVMIGHDNLLANLARIEQMIGVPDAIAVSWLPAYHDLGLIGCTFLPVSSGRKLVFMSPLAFMQRPVRWWRAVSKYRATTTAAPNFAYELCLRKIAAADREELDLRCLRLALNGAEMVRAETIERFSEAFAPCGFRREMFYPCYGLAEATLMVTGPTISEPPVVRSFDAQALGRHQAVAVNDEQTPRRRLVGCGRCIPGQQIAIVDTDTRKRCDDRRVGEIWVAGPSVGQGYWNSPRETAKVFQARLAGSYEGPFLRTGDLGFLDDGELFVTGRVKDLMIFRGRNYYPQDIEQTVQKSHPSLKPDAGAAFSVEVDGQERLVVVHEVLRPRQLDIPAVFAAIRRAVAGEHDLPLESIALIAAGTLPKTSSGKRRRNTCREQFLAEKLEIVAAWPADEATGNRIERNKLAPPVDQIEARLCVLWAELLDVASVATDEQFFELGGQSLIGGQLLARVREEFGVDLPLVAIFEAPTVGQLARRIAAATVAANATVPKNTARIEHVDRCGELPLSFAQQRFWFLEQWESVPRNNVPVTIALRGRLDRNVLEACLQEIALRHDVSRMKIVSRDGRPEAWLVPDRTIALEFVDLAAASTNGHAGKTDAQPPELRRLLDEQARQPFDLEHDPLVRATLARLRPAVAGVQEEHALILTAHHIVCDGWSLGVFLRELAALYDALLAGQPKALDDLPCQYADFAAWQRARLESPAIAGQLAYWHEQFVELPPRLDLATDRPRKSSHTLCGASESAEIPAELRTALERLAHDAGATMYMTLLAAFETLLARLTGQSDFCLGTVVANRVRVEFEPLIGLFINTLPLRVELAGRPSFRELLARVRSASLDALANQDVPFERLVEALSPGRDPAQTPLFQAMFIFENLPWNGAQAGGLTIGDVRVEHAALAAYDLSLVIDETAGALRATLVYDAELFDAVTIRRMLNTFEILLRSVVATPDNPLIELPILSDEERRLLAEWGHGPSIPRPNTTIQRLFANQVERTPEATAVICGPRRLCYRELDQSANQLAHWLQALGVGPDVPVAVLLERSVEMVAAVLGILKAGGAYVPLDPRDPPQRMSAVLDDANPRAIVTQASLVDRLPPHKAEEVLIDDDAAEIARQSDACPPDQAEPRNLAYVIYTSGSTGLPKGVEVIQRGLVNHCLALAEKNDYHIGRRVLHIVPLTFDAAAEGIFPALISGATYVTPSADAEISCRQVFDECRRHEIDTLHLPPVLWQQCLADLEPDDASLLQRLNVMLTGGEAPSAEALSQWTAVAPHVRMLYAYGLTETTITSTIHELQLPGDLASLDRLPIGRPIANTEVYVLDAQLRPLPIGAAGELCIAGPGLARGYRGQPQLTAERFVSHPFREELGARLFRTGDLARFRSDGAVEFLGRIDQQIKLRGFRIEPGEIERTLVSHPAVREAAVVVREDAPGVRRLVAYVVLSANASPPNGELRTWLRGRFPDPMVPTSIVQLPSIPRTTHLKLDRQALPPPPAVHRRNTGAPRTPVESLLADIWQQVLAVEHVGVDDNFFELGGDSIQTIQVVARARKAGIAITVKQLFVHQTIGELAAVAGEVRPPDARHAVNVGPCRLSPIQCWFFEQAPADPHYFNQSVLLDVAPDLGPDVLEATLAWLATHHDALRLRFTCSPSGWQATIADPRTADHHWPLERYDLSDLPANERESAYLTAAAGLQASLDLASGPLARAGWFDLGHDLPPRLLLIAHHLAVDAVSWRILLADLQTVARQIACGDPPSLPEASTPLVTWSDRLVERARSADLFAESEFWLDDSRRNAAPLPRDDRGDNFRTKTRGVATVFDESGTGELLAAQGAGEVTVHALLLTALARVVGRWTGVEDVLFDVEGHGRAPFADDLDVSQTVGWFTTWYPLQLTLPAGLEGNEAVLRVQDALERTPKQGASYGLLRWLRGDEQLAAALAAMPQAEVSFNYLGRFECLFEPDSPFSISDAGMGPQQSPRQRRSHLLDVNAYIRDGRLHVEWSYSRAIHCRETIERLAGSFAAELRTLVRGSGSEVRPSVAESNVEASFPLTGMQQLMLVHALRAPDSDVLQEELRCTLTGPLDVAALRGAWQNVLRRHAALRTEFRWHGVEPRQVVERAVELAFSELDWRGLSADEQSRRLAAWRRDGRRQPFDFTRAPLMRLSLVQLGDERFLFSLRGHHLLFDGWSLAVVACEAFEIYQALAAGRPPRLAPAPPLSEYIAWLGRQDRAAAERFWQMELAGFRRPTPLVFAAPAPDEIDDVGGGDYAEVTQSVSLEVSSQISAWTRRERLTLGTVFAGAWALLLARHAQCDDVLFGVAVSGRPAELSGIEQMVGPFVNNLPLRVRLPSAQSTAGQTAPAPPPGEWLRSVQAALAGLGQHSYCSLAEIGPSCGPTSAGRLFESLLVFQNYPLASASAERVGPIVIGDLEATTRTGYPLTLVAVPGAELRISLRFDTRRFSAAAIAAAAAEFEQILRDLANDTSSMSSFCPNVAKEKPETVMTALPPTVQRPAALAYVAPSDELERQLAALWEQLLNFAPVGTSDNFFAIGGDSLLAVRLMAEVERLHGRRLPLAWLFQDATIEHLARVLRAPSLSTRVSPLVPIRPVVPGAGVPLFCVHPAGGTVFCYRDLARHLPSTRPVYGLQARGIDGLEPPHSRIEDMAADFLVAIREVQPEGPYHLAGWSLGGVVAYELARQLVAAGASIGRLIVIDAGIVPPGERFREEEFLPMLLSLFPHDKVPAMDELRGMQPADQLAFFRERARQAGLVADGGPMADHHVFQVFQANINALAEYEPRPYSGSVKLLRASDNATPLHAEAQMGWDLWATGGVEVLPIDGGHVRLFSEPYVAALAERIEALLAYVGTGSRVKNRAAPEVDDSQRFAR
jgi:amino acid adenylation domain-containing protein/non-ribosomal peptide synthase protein (TIGR01720 family)